MDPTYPLIPILNLVACLLALLTLLTGFTRQSWNICVVALTLWVAVMSLITSVDTFVWSNNSTIKLLFWCDISEFIFHFSGS